MYVPLSGDGSGSRPGHALFSEKMKDLKDVGNSQGQCLGHTRPTTHQVGGCWRGCEDYC